MIEERHADLERPRHRVAIERLDDVAVHAGREIPVLEPVDGVLRRQIRRRFRLDRRVGGDRARQLGGIQKAAILRAERPGDRAEPLGPRTDGRPREPERALHPLGPRWQRPPTPREPHQPGDHAHPPVGLVPPVPAEHLVGALAGERDLDLRRRHLRDPLAHATEAPSHEVLRAPHAARQEAEVLGSVARPVGAQVVAGEAVQRGQRAHLVEAGVVELQTERIHGASQDPRRERRDPARVDAAREPRADRDVGTQVDANGIFEAREESFGPLALGEPRAILLVDERRRPPAPHLLPAALEDEHVAGPEALDARAHRARLEHPSPCEEVVDGRGVEAGLDQAGREKRLEFRGERDPLRRPRPDEGLDPQPVTREHQTPARLVPEREREHPAQALHAIDAQVLVQVDDRLDVRPGAEAVPRASQLVAQLDVVVDLAIADDDHRSVLARDRLIACLEVDDRQAADAEPDSGRDVRALSVRSAVDERGRHSRDHGLFDRPVRIVRRDPADPAHQGATSGITRARERP